jgi:hypothetical protein
MVFQNRVLRGIFGPKREEVVGGWRILCNEEFHNLYTSQNINRWIKSRRVRWAGHVACMGEMRIENSILVGKPEGKKSLRRCKHRWVDDRMDLTEIRWESVD